VWYNGTMLKYTCSANIKHRLNAIRTEPWKQDRSWNLACELASVIEIPKEHQFTVKMLLTSREFEDIVFYSKKPVNFVPVMGYMLPVSLFDIEIIHE
jgi:hypothetical protein